MQWRGKLSVRLALIVVVALLAACSGFAQSPESSLYEKMPFMRLTMTARLGGQVHEVLPIAFPNNRRPAPLPKTGELLVRFVANPLNEYSVSWSSIEKIELFAELVEQEFLERLKTLENELRNLTSDNTAWPNLAVRFETLFDYLRNLEQYRDELPNLSRHLNRFLFLEGQYLARSNDYFNAAARFERLFGPTGENRHYPELEATWSQAANRAMELASDAENEARIQQILNHFKQFYPANPIVADWEKRLRDYSLRFFEQSKNEFANKDFIAAYRQYEAARRISPSLPELREWGEKLFAAAPHVHIATAWPLRDAHEGGSLPSWNTLRGRRILCDMLCEYKKPSFEGGVYVSSLGTIERLENNRRLQWHFSGDARQAWGILDIADSIIENANAPVESFMPGSETLGVRLLRAVLIPEALFELPIRPSERFARPEDSSLQTLGLYVKRNLDAGLIGLQLNEAHQAKDALPLSLSLGSPKMIFEHTVRRGEEALDRLQRGDVDMIDRIPPWEYDRLKDNRQFVTGRYAIPTVHFLVPNKQKPLPRSRTFRRALLYGLNRSAMLEKLIGKDGVRTGRGAVLSAPFVKGASLDDPLGYGYDNSIQPRPYEPKLAIALSLLALDQLRNNEPGWGNTETMPDIVLARPDNETAEYTTLLIQRQWQAIGITTSIVIYDDSEPIGQDDNIDFWLVDRIIKEPLVDAAKIFGSTGLCRLPSPYMELALEKLSQALDWPTAGKCLQGIHRLCYEETSVLPLWQIHEHFVYRAGIDNVVADAAILDLYQNIRQWTVTEKR